MTTDSRTIEYMPLAELVTRLHPQNPKSHDIGAIIESYKVHGYVASGVIDSRTGLFLAGHGRTIALNMMQKQGMAAPDGIRNGGDDWLVPVQVGYESKNDTQAKAYIVADNKLTMAGAWNEPALAELLQEVAGSADVALSSTGFSGDELDDLLRDLGMAEEPPEDPGAQIDRAEELNKKWGVVRGDVWAVGSHRIMCGDSTCAEDVEKLMDGVKADLLLADPPYGKLEIFNKKGQVGNAGSNKAESKNYGAYVGHKEFKLNLLLDCLDGHYEKAVIWGGNYFTDILPVSSSWLVWDKRANKNLFYADCELAWTNLGITAKVFDFVWQGMIRAGNKIVRTHPTQKPLELYVWVISLTDVNIIFDPTFGSGSCLVACHQTDRIGYGMEIHPPYVAVCLERLEGLGLTPTRLNGSGG